MRKAIFRHHYILTTVICVFAVLWYIFGVPMPRPFNSQDWKTDKWHRYAMYGDLRSKHKLIGMSQTELVDLLGKPDSGQLAATCEVAWRMEPFGGLDDSWLVVNLSADRVVNCEVDQR